jgi:iron complex outermembrane receptor protein
MSVRGMSSSHTLVLLDGVRLNSTQNGLVDLGLWMPDGLDRVEYVRGGQSALYGTDAVGGAVNVRTRDTADSLRLTLRGTAGSCGLAGGGLAISGAALGLRLSVGAAHEQARGNYLYRAREGERDLRRERAHSAYRLTSLHASAQSEIGPSTRVSVHSFLNQGMRESPGPAVNAAYRDATLWDRELNMILQSATSFTVGTLDLSAHYQQGLQRYEDRTPMFLFDTEYDNRRWELAGQWTQALSKSLLVLVGAEGGWAGLTAREVRAGTSRWHRSVFVGAEWETRTPVPFVDRSVLYPMVRLDDFSDSHRAVSPRLGGNVWLLPEGDLQIRGSVGWSFRVPNFNELYWIDGGNPALRHERAVTTDLGAVALFSMGGQHAVDVSFFEISMHDRITGWPPVNLTRSRNRGVELGWKWEPDFLLSSFEFHGSYTSARNLTAQGYGKQLPFVPRWQMTAAGRADVGALAVNVTSRFVSRRYTTLDESPALSVDPYILVDTEMSTGVTVSGIRMRVHLTVENIFDQPYEVMKGYPMPLRTYRAGAVVAY